MYVYHLARFNINLQLETGLHSLGKVKMENHMENSLYQILIYRLSAREGQVLIVFSPPSMTTHIQEEPLPIGYQTAQK